MWNALGDALPLAAGLALSPAALTTGIILLLGRRGRLKASVFGIGWFIAILVIAALAYAIIDAGDSAAPDTTATSANVVQLIFAALFLVLAGLTWRKRPQPGQPPAESKLLDRLDNTSTSGAGILGLAQGFLVVKNVPLALGAGAGIGEAQLGPAATAVTLVLFGLLSTAGVIVPVVFATVGGKRSGVLLGQVREWLELNMATIGIVVLLILAAYFAGHGLEILQ